MDSGSRVPMETPARNFEVLVQETYEAVLRPGDIAIDVGAHKGRHCIVMAERVFPTGRVLAFEPLPVCRERIEKEIAEYDPALSNVLTVFPYALGDCTGATEFVVAKDALAFSGLKERQYEWPTELERISIEVRRLDDLCAGLPAVRYLKVDAEGGEYHILQGAEQTLKCCRPVVAFEFGVNSIAEYKITPRDMAQFWSKLNYLVFDIVGNLLDETGFVANAEQQKLWDYVAVPAEATALQQTLVEVLTRPPAWHRVTTHLDAADHNVQIAGGIPPLVGFQGLKFWLVRRYASLVCYATKFVSGPQKACSQSLLYSLRAMLKILRDREAETARLAARLAELESKVAALSQRIQ
jgi:FkbM family methyltransferase